MNLYVISYEGYDDDGHSFIGHTYVAAMSLSEALSWYVNRWKAGEPKDVQYLGSLHITEQAAQNGVEASRRLQWRHS